MEIENEGIAAMFDPGSVAEVSEVKKKVKVKSFSLTQDDLKVIDSIRSRLGNKLISLSESEVVRIALQSIFNMTDDDLLTRYKNIQKVPVGRPQKQ